MLGKYIQFFVSKSCDFHPFFYHFPAFKANCKVAIFNDSISISRNATGAPQHFSLFCSVSLNGMYISIGRTNYIKT